VTSSVDDRGSARREAGSECADRLGMAEMRQVLEQMRVEFGVAELVAVVDQKLVRFNENITISDDGDAVVGSFIGQLKRYLQDPTKLVLLDATMASPDALIEATRAGQRIIALPPPTADPAVKHSRAERR
jgi:hypothetical protein